jgi:gas vesicle protein
MRIQYAFAIVGLSALFALPAHAQDVKKDVKKVGDETHHVLKKTGNAVKQDAKDVGTAAHHTLKTAGNTTKTDLGNATGIHKVGGDVGKAAQTVSRTGKRVGRSAKHTVKRSTSMAHDSLTKAGKNAKAAVKNP